MCFYLEGGFRNYMLSELEKVSDIPKAIENQPLCPLYIKVRNRRFKVVLIVSIITFNF